MAPVTSHSSSSGNPISGSCDSHPSAYALRNSLPVSRPLTQAPLTEQGAEVIPSSDSQRQLCRVWGQSPPRCYHIFGRPSSLIPSPCYSQLHPDLGERAQTRPCPSPILPAKEGLFEGLKELIWPPSLNAWEGSPSLQREPIAAKEPIPEEGKH